MNNLVGQVLLIVLFLLIFSASGSATEQIPVDSEFTAVEFDGSGFDATRTYEPSYVFANGEHRIYYQGLPFSNQLQVGLSTSSDGINWEKYSDDPVISLSEAPDFASFRIGARTVMYEDGVYKMWFWGNNTNSPSTARSTGFGYATSIDGVNWDILPDAIRVRTGIDQGYNLVEVVKFNNQYVAYFYENPPGDLIRAVSDDGINFYDEKIITASPGPNQRLRAATVYQGRVVGIWTEDRIGPFPIGTSTDGINFEFSRTVSNPNTGPRDIVIEDGIVTLYSTLDMGNVK